MDVVDLHGRAAEGFDARLRRVADDQWELPTPCDEWNVRALVEHVLGNHARMAGRLNGNAVELGGDPIAAWSVLRSQMRAGLATPGVLERVAPSPFGGEAPIAALARILTADLTAHTWDLARAIGADEVLDPDLVAELLPLVRLAQPALAGSGKFADAVAVPESAGAQQHLLALFGRDAR
jgi:uncharacterized protein (TIGR03086 family)